MMRYMPYGLWYRAERDARRLPPSQPNLLAILFMLFIGTVAMVSLASQGGFGIVLAICCGLGIISGLKK